MGESAIPEDCTVSGFRHEALFYEGSDDLIRRTVPFVRDGVEAGEPVMVAMSADKNERLRAALGSKSESVGFVDMRVLGRNPARIIPAWHRFVESIGHGRPVRGIGEPIWAGRSQAELAESQLHEALINLSLAGADAMTLLCPYDVTSLPEHVLHEARCSHPHLTGHGGNGGSEVFCDIGTAHRPFDQPLPRPVQRPEVIGVDRTTLGDVRRLVADRAASAGLGAFKVNSIVLAVHELAANSLRHGGGTGVLRVWVEGGALVCEVKDRGHIRDPLVGRRNPGADQPGGRGLWIVNQLCDLVQVRTGPSGTVVRVVMRPDDVPAASPAPV